MENADNMKEFCEYLSVTEVSRILHCSKFLVYQLITEKLLSGFKLNRTWRIDKTSVERFLNKKQKYIQ